MIASATGQGEVLVAELVLPCRADRRGSGGDAQTAAKVVHLRVVQLQGERGFIQQPVLGAAPEQ